jgi:hypothetical protein
MGATRGHVTGWPRRIDPQKVYRLWCRAGQALLAASLAYGGRAEAIHEEDPALPRLAEAAKAMGIGLEEARGAIHWWLGEGERGGEDEMAHLVGLLAGLLTGLPKLFRQALALPLARRASRLLGESQGGGSLSQDAGKQASLADLVMGRVKETLEARF